ncbi:MAG: hypothetical protein J5979_02170 [Lachnospiraceae bacterium]|nr:hypothetical protein [Lachnospiraceae bacterium]
MQRIEEIILQAHNEILQKEGISKKSDLSMELNRENGLNSFALVTLILEVEEKLNINLDDALPQIRKASSLQEFAEIVYEMREKTVV